jgi:tetratricopeptide (TPR) repeat protein
MTLMRPHFFTLPQWRRPIIGGVLALAVVAFGLAWPAVGAGARAGSPAGAQTIRTGDTPTGNYLAALHAREVREEAEAAKFLLQALKTDPDNALLIQHAFVALIMSGRIEEGVALARRLDGGSHGNALASLIIAVDAIKKGAYDEAITTIESVTGEGIVKVITPILIAWSDAGAGRTDHALERLAKTAGSPRGVDTLYQFHAAWINDQAGRSAAAARVLDQALVQDEELWLRLAQLAGAVYRRAGEPDRAAKIYDAFTASHPGARELDGPIAALKAGKPAPQPITSAADGAAEALLDAAGLFARQNDRETSLLLGQLGLYLRPDFPHLQIVVAEVMERGGRYEDANALYAKVDRRSPLTWTARIGTARNLERMDRSEEAEALLRALAAERPDDPGPLVELGDMFRRAERFGDAVKAYDAAVGRIDTLRPGHWQLLYARGIALEREKQWPRAEADFLKALEFEPDQPFVLNYLGYSWVEQGRNLGEAETMIRKAVDLRPNDGYIVDSLGWVLYRLGRYEESVTEMEKAVELKPEDPVINDHLGDAYWMAGRQREARFQWQTALDLKPDADLKAEIEAKLEHGLIRQANAAAP